MNSHRQRIEQLRERLRGTSKVAFAPPMAAPPMDPAMMGGAPPMDPAMMGGAPPMDPTMMGGAPPMDPTMMGAPMPAAPMDMAATGGMPMDPAAMGGGEMPIDPATMAQLQQMAAQLGLGGGQPAQDTSQLNEKIDAIGYLVLEIAKVLGIDDQDEGTVQADPEAIPQEMVDEGAGGPPSMDGGAGPDPEHDQVLSDAAQTDPATKMAKVGEGGDSYIARQLARMRR